MHCSQKRSNGGIERPQYRRNSKQTGAIVIALGANTSGHWGQPVATLRRAVDEVNRLGLTILACAPVRRTRPMGASRQPAYANTVVLARGSIAPAALLRALKRIERRAGRRTRPRWSARPLDLDIVAHGGRRLNAGAIGTRRGYLQLPHPGLHTRDFVLRPLADIAPFWWHPVMGRTARQLLRGLGTPRPGPRRAA